MDDYQSLNAMLQEKTVKERRNFLTLLMNGEFDTELNIIEEAAHAGIRLVQKEYWCLAVRREKNCCQRQKNVQRRKQNRYGIR